MHLMPYIDSLWFGEGFDYSAGPAYWLVESSGIPFGLMGDMMGAGHVWRGMLHGMTTRFRCADPSALWRLWDAFGMGNSTMVGYWDEMPVVTTSCTAVLATAYVIQASATMVAIASWGGEEELCSLHFEWESLGLKPAGVKLYAPDLISLGQPGPASIPLRKEDKFAPAIKFAAGGGAVLILESV